MLFLLRTTIEQKKKFHIWWIWQGHSSRLFQIYTNKTIFLTWSKRTMWKLLLLEIYKESWKQLFLMSEMAFSKFKRELRTILKWPCIFALLTTASWTIIRLLKWENKRKSKKKDKTSSCLQFKKDRSYTVSW